MGGVGNQLEILQWRKCCIDAGLPHQVAATEDLERGDDRQRGVQLTLNEANAVESGCRNAFQQPEVRFFPLHAKDFPRAHSDVGIEDDDGEVLLPHLDRLWGMFQVMIQRLQLRGDVNADMRIGWQLVRLGE